MKKIVLLLLTVWFTACSPYKKALDHFDSAEYEPAVRLFKNELKKGGADAGELNFKIAESYRLSNRPAAAYPFYQAAQKAGFSDDNLKFYIAQAAKSAGENKESLALFEKYLADGSDPDFRELAQIEVKNAEIVAKIRETKSYSEIENLESINTAASEFSPMVLGENVIFSSSRRGEKVFLTDGSGFTDLYALKIKDTTSFSGSVSDIFGAKINSDAAHEASATFSADGKTMIFARSNRGEKNEPTKEVNLYESKFNGTAWSEPVLLDRICIKDQWDACPALSPDGKILWFASNRETDSYGNIDIFRAEKDENDEWGSVRNAGKAVNGKGNDLFPYQAPDGRFFFSSDAGPGMGGLDLFLLDTAADKSLKKRNLGLPINSEGDDFGIVLRTPVSGFFSSNRKGDSAKGNDDIYSFSNDSLSQKKVLYCLRGITYSDENGKREILPETEVILRDASGEIIGKVNSETDGKFQFDNITPEQIFELTGTKTSYVRAQKKYSTVGKSVDPLTLPGIENTICFDVELDLYRDLFGGGKMPELLILYPYDQAVITPEAAKLLDDFMEFLSAYFDEHSDAIIELGSHTDARGGRGYNQKLSQRRAQSAVDYLISKGIDKERITAKGYGKDALKIQNARTEAEHQANRRTTFKVLTK